MPEEKKNITVEQEIVSTFYDDDYFGMITESDEEQQHHKYKMELYRKNGTKCFQTYFDMEYSVVRFTGKKYFCIVVQKSMFIQQAWQI